VREQRRWSKKVATDAGDAEGLAGMYARVRAACSQGKGTTAPSLTPLPLSTHPSLPPPGSHIPAAPDFYIGTDTAYQSSICDTPTYPRQLSPLYWFASAQDTALGVYTLLCGTSQSRTAVALGGLEGEGTQRVKCSGWRKSACIHSPSCTGAVCSRHRPDSENIARFNRNTVFPCSKLDSPSSILFVWHTRSAYSGLRSTTTQQTASSSLSYARTPITNPAHPPTLNTANTFRVAHHVFASC
jgi:hypothetical protein